MNDDILHQQFRDTNYQICLHNQTITLKVDAIPHEIFELFEGLESWAFITAFNPLPEVLSPRENKRRNDDLFWELHEAGYHVYKAIGVAPDNSWREDSFFITNITLEHARQFAQKYGQRAILFGTKNAPATLIYLGYCLAP